MIVLLSGEGITDIGMTTVLDRIAIPSEWVPGPMALLVDQIFYNTFHYSMIEYSGYFVSESLLTYIAKTISPHKLRGVNTAKFHKKNSYALGMLAIELGLKIDDCVTAIFFRDCDGSQSSPNNRYQTIRDSISGQKGGFKSAGMHNGVAMVPNPKSEAWLLCAIKENPYTACNKLEKESGNDTSKNPLKEQLQNRLHYYGNISITSCFIQNNNPFIDSERIEMNSFIDFKSELKQAFIIENNRDWYNSSRQVDARVSDFLSSLIPA